MRLVVGLGNPGSAYASTRHNVGFAVVEELACRWRLPLGCARHGLRTVDGMFAGRPVMLVEPQMYMNLSGEALARSGLSITTAELLVVHDDLDLDCGRVRVKRCGGAGGHRGVESITALYGPEFARVRVGIGRSPHGVDTATYVLSRCTGTESELMTTAVQRAADAVECIVQHGEDTAMNSFNARLSGSPPASAAPMGRK